VLFRVGALYPVSFPFRPSPWWAAFLASRRRGVRPLTLGEGLCVRPSTERIGRESGVTSVRSVPFAGDPSGPHRRFIPPFPPQLWGRSPSVPGECRIGASPQDPVPWLCI